MIRITLIEGVAEEEIRDLNITNINGMVGINSIKKIPDFPRIRTLDLLIPRQFMGATMRKKAMAMTIKI